MAPELPLPALVRYQPVLARMRVMAAVEAAQGDLQVAAEQLGVSYRSLHRYVAALDLHARVARVRGRYPSRMGRPLGARDKAPRAPRKIAEKRPAEKKRPTR